jgi:hypothetical protein
MKPLLLLTGVVALGFSGPGLAKPGMGQGNGHAFGFGMGHGHTYAIDREEMHSRGLRRPVGYGAGGCPPGLAKKAVSCMPPGQARKLGIGSLVPRGYNLLSDSSLPRAGPDTA